MRPKLVAILIVALFIALFSGAVRPAMEATTPDGKKVVVLTQEEAIAWSAAREILENRNEKLTDELNRLKMLAHEGCLRS